MTTVAALAAALAAALLSLPAAAILTRPDRDDEEYRELSTRYPAAVRLGGQGGAGALIAPRWVLTAAHQAVALKALRRPLDIAGREYAIQDVFIHPSWKAGGDSDIALVFLRESVSGIDPVALYRRSDEAGQAARIVGFGETGRIGGSTAQRNADGRARAAINTVDRVTARTLGVLLKGPEDASDLQGALAPGDGGAPAFFESGGRFFVAGIAAPPDARAAGGPGAGDWETYTRVSAFADWIDDMMSRTAVEEAARSPDLGKRKSRR